MQDLVSRVIDIARQLQLFKLQCDQIKLVQAMECDPVIRRRAVNQMTINTFDVLGLMGDIQPLTTAKGLEHGHD